MFNFRENKKSCNKDDLKVLLWGIVISVCLLNVSEPVAFIYDKHFADRPFLTAELGIVNSLDHKKPLLLYDADATQPVTATWIATIKTEDDTRISTRRAKGEYSNNEDSPTLWTWDSFFDPEDGVTISPKVPNFPFKVCLRYSSVITVDTGATDETPIICTKLYYPPKGIEDD